AWQVTVTGSRLLPVAVPLFLQFLLVIIVAVVGVMVVVVIIVTVVVAVESSYVVKLSFMIT
ncbi:hypothetical protein Tco_0354616, partial [Tanacetum coccineum]